MVRVLTKPSRRLRSLLICIITLIANGSAVTQEMLGQNPAATKPSLPDAPSPNSPSPQTPTATSAAEIADASPEVRQTIEDQSDDQENPALFRHHLIKGRFWISGQSNFIFQAHTPFHSPYSGPNSFHAYGEAALSGSFTLFTGVRLLHFTELIATADEESGRGVSDGLGIAAYINADVIDPDLSRGIYLSRLFIHQTIALTLDRYQEQPQPFYLQPSLPLHRIELSFGKISLLDFFDVNEVGSDSHLQFTNLAIGNNGIYEYAGDGHGYTLAAMVNYQGPKFGLRFAEALLPNLATGTGLDYDLRHTRSANFEFNEAAHFLRNFGTQVRALAFLNYADLGNYHEANAAYLAGLNSTPDVTLYRHQGTFKPGFGLNLEQNLPANFRVFFRAGWNNGRYESFTFSEMNNSVSFGGDLSGQAWHRKYDRVGSAYVNSGLSDDHRKYLALGGIGFMLGDGKLRYGREIASETYYTAYLGGGLYLAAQISFVNNPGFNLDRGPVIVPGLRAHIDF